MTRTLSSRACAASPASDPKTPTPTGHHLHRPVFGSGEQRRGNYPPTKWRSADGLVHVASMASNHALCELVNEHFSNRLYLLITEAVEQRALVTCVPCIGNAWRFEDEFDILGTGARIAQPVPLHKRRRHRV